MAIGIALGLLTGILVGWFTSFNYWLDPIVKNSGTDSVHSFCPSGLDSFSYKLCSQYFSDQSFCLVPVTILTNPAFKMSKKLILKSQILLSYNFSKRLLMLPLQLACPMFLSVASMAPVPVFITLMTAEMLGVKYGIGWYINWQREVFRLC